MTQIIPLTEVLYEDRSGAELDDKCGMAYFWNRVYGERGIVPVKESFALRIGGETHEDLAAVAQMEDISPEAIDALVKEITDPLTDEDKLHQETMEVLYRRLGWLAAFALYMEPRIRKEYETVSIENELILDRYPLWVGVTPDRLLRHIQGKYLVYREYKTTISASQKWIQSWPFAIQMHLGIAAAEEEVKERVAFGQVMGLMKGDYRGGKLSHPYVWGWRRGSEWTHEYTKARATGWEPAPVWDYSGGVVEWVQKCGEEIALSQFPHSAPVFKNEKMISEWVSRRVHRQQVIAAVAAEVQTDLDSRNIYFEKRTRSCRPGFGDACPYMLACWNAAVEQNPLASGEYIERTPHHDVELAVEGGIE